MKLFPTFTFLALAIATPAVFAADPAHTTAATETAKDASKDGQAMENYAAISTALYKDDLAAAQKSAGELAKTKEGTLAKHSQAIADSKTLADARTHFKLLSDAAIVMNQDSKTLHQAHCPMASDGKGADWLQTSADEVQNPYMGAKMPHCGKLAK